MASRRRLPVELTFLLFKKAFRDWEQETLSGNMVTWKPLYEVAQTLGEEAMRSSQGESFHRDYTDAATSKFFSKATTILYFSKAVYLQFMFDACKFLLDCIFRTGIYHFAFQCSTIRSPEYKDKLLFLALLGFIAAVIEGVSAVIWW